MFNRVKSQTTSTRYLSVVPDFTKIKGTDGQPMMEAQTPNVASDATQFPGLTVHAAAWESFIIYLVDPALPLAAASERAPLHPDWPAPPANALDTGVTTVPIRYNSTVVLQSLQTGVCSPILIIRRIDQDSDVVGMDGTVTDPWVAVPDGEQPGDLVSQLQKVAFELHNVDAHAFDSRLSTTWLGCDQDSLAGKVMAGDRRWSPVPNRPATRPHSLPTTPQSRFGVLPMTPHTAPLGLPSTPSSPVSSSSSMDYFGARSRNSSSSTLWSPLSLEAPLPTGHQVDGQVRRQRTGSTGAFGRHGGPFARPAGMSVHRPRISAGAVVGSEQQASIPASSSSYEHLPNAAELKMFWTMNVGDACVW